MLGNSRWVKTDSRIATSLRPKKCLLVNKLPGLWVVASCQGKCQGCQEGIEIIFAYC